MAYELEGEIQPDLQAAEAAHQSFVARANEIQDRILSDPELSRRTLLKGLGAFIGLTAFQGLGALRVLSVEAQEIVPLAQAVGDACAEAEPACMPIKAGEARELVKVKGTATTTPKPAVTTTVPPPPTTQPPPPPTTSPPRVSQASVEAAKPLELPTPERRGMPYQEFEANAELMLARLPSLETMHSLFPGTAFFENVAEQKQHIENLDRQIQLDVGEFRRFGFDESRVGVFRGGRMAPRMLIWHWTGDHYETVDDIVNMFKESGNSVHAYIHHDVSPHRFAGLGTILGHSLGMNAFAMGLEVYSGYYDNVRSPLFNYDVARTKMGLYASVNMLRAQNLPVNPKTLMSHFAGDLIFNNPYYDPYTGNFREIPGHKPPNVRKFDQPQEFMQMIVPKAMALDAALGPR